MNNCDILRNFVFLHLDMKQTVIKILALLSFAVYFISGIGFGVHHCSSDGSSHFYSLFSSSDCEDLHSHRLSDGGVLLHSHSCSCSHTVPDACEGDVLYASCCCDDSVFVLEADYVNESGHGRDLLAVLQPVDSGFAPVKEDSLYYVTFSGSDESDICCPVSRYLSRVSVWRL